MRPAPDRASQHRLPSGIRDNLDRGKVGDFLKAHIQPSANLAIVSVYFTFGGTIPVPVNQLKRNLKFPEPSVNMPPGTSKAQLLLATDPVAGLERFALCAAIFTIASFTSLGGAAVG